MGASIKRAVVKPQNPISGLFNEEIIVYTFTDNFKKRDLVIVEIDGYNIQVCQFDRYKDSSSTDIGIGYIAGFVIGIDERGLREMKKQIDYEQIVLKSRFPMTAMCQLWEKYR